MSEENKGSWKDTLRNIGLMMSGAAAPFVGDNDWMQRQQDFALKQKEYETSLANTDQPVFSIDQSGKLIQVGFVPKGSKVVTPSSMMTPQEKADIQVDSAAKRDSAVRAKKLSELRGTIDFFTKKIGEVPGGYGLSGRVKGFNTAISGALQTNPDVAAYMASLEGMRSQIARGLGEVGNLSEYEQKYAVKLLPSVTDNIETRQKKIKNFYEYIDAKIGGSSEKPINTKSSPDYDSYLKAIGAK